MERESLTYASIAFSVNVEHECVYSYATEFRNLTDILVYNFSSLIVILPNLPCIIYNLILNEKNT